MAQAQPACEGLAPDGPPLLPLPLAPLAQRRRGAHADFDGPDDDVHVVDAAPLAARPATDIRLVDLDRVLAADAVRGHRRAAVETRHSRNAGWRWNWTADMPGVCDVTRYAAQNQTCNGVCVPCITVPAVREAWWRQLRHSSSVERVRMR